jgi:hypothetical protein
MTLRISFIHLERRKSGDATTVTNSTRLTTKVCEMTAKRTRTLGNVCVFIQIKKEWINELLQVEYI